MRSEADLAESAMLSEAELEVWATRCRGKVPPRGRMGEKGS